VGAIEDTLRRYPQSPVVRDVLGTWEATEIDALVRELVPGADSVFHFECSIGALFGVRLRDGRRVALKVHVRVAEDYLDAMQRVQSHLAARGFPCPRPLARRGAATVEEWVDHGSYRDAHEPGVRRAMAATLARLHALAREQEARPRRAFLVEQESSLWPTPHNALFDFGATADGAEWIDEVAREARAARGAAGETVVGHTDWSVKHLRFDDGLRPTVVYDWDSLHTGLEPHLVGIAAATFTYTEHLPVEVWPEPAEARAFLDEYEQARGTPFARDERRAAEAAAVYSSAYGARCTHAVGGDAAAGPLPAYAEAFL
jgi:aminoglycoside phosphotransferase (APT) family kinase protein